MMFKYTCLLLIIFLTSCSDFTYEKNIYKNYYLIGVDTKDNISISIKLKSGDFSARIQWVKQYAIANDTFLFAKAINNININDYYILNMSKDSEYAKIEDVVIGPLDSLSFANNWGMRYKVKFISVTE